MTEQFDGSSFNSSAVDDVAGALYAGALFGNISYPRGTNASSAVEMFDTSEAIQAPLYNLSANVLSFHPKLECESAEIIDNLTMYNCTSSGCQQLWATANVKSQGCSIPSLSGLRVRSENKSLVWDFWVGTVLAGRCDGEHADSEDAQRLVVLSYVQPHMHGPIENSTAVICKPSVKVQRSKVTIDELSSLKGVENGGEIQTSPKISPTQIVEAVNNTIIQLSEIGIFTDTNANTVNGTVKSINNFFSLIMSSQGALDTKESSNTDVIAKGVQTVFQGVASQIVKRYLLVGNSTSPTKSFIGTAQYTQQRLFVSGLSMRIMEFTIGTLGIISLILAFISPRECTPEDPASIARMASLIYRSRDLMNTLSTSGSRSVKDLKGLLCGTYMTRFISDVSSHDARPTFVIESNGSNKSHSSEEEDQVKVGEAYRYWQPITTKWPARLALPVLPLCIIVVLEITLRKSQKSDGLLDVKNDTGTQIGFTYVPALVMVLVKLLYSSFDFNLRILDPYVQINNGFAKAKPSILSKTIYTWKTDAFWSSFMTGRTAVGASALAMILSSFLTIAVSGLYTPQETQSNHTMALTHLDQLYNPVAYPAGSTNNPQPYINQITWPSTLAARLVVYGEMDTPLGTYGPNVLPNLTMPQDGSSGLNVTSIVVSVPVQHGALSCSLIPEDQVIVTNDRENNATSNTTNSGMDIYWPMPNVNLTECTNFGQNATLARSYIRAVADGYWAAYSTFEPFIAPESANCPSSWARFGQWKNGSATEVNVMTCWSSLQESQAHVSFSLPDWKITSFKLDKSTTRNISTSMDTNLDLARLVFTGTRAAGSIDSVFSGIIRNQTTDSLDTTLLRRSNFERLYSQMQDVYSLSFAQIMNLQGRNTTVTNGQSINGTVTSVGAYRLCQDSVSTRVLQGLLAGLAICAIISLLTVRLSRVMPKNPCSIAAQASLISDSSILKILPPRAEWMDDKEFNELFYNKLYSMAWRINGDGTKAFCIDVKSSGD